MIVNRLDNFKLRGKTYHQLNMINEGPTYIVHHTIFLLVLNIVEPLMNFCIRPDLLISSFRRHRVISSASMVDRRRRHLECFTSGTCQAHSIWQSGALHVYNQSPAMWRQGTSGRCNIKAWFLARLWSATSGKFKLQSHAHERSYTGFLRSDWNIPR